MLNVYVIVEQGERTYWKPCGVAFENRDGSFNIKLDLFPGVTLNMKERKESTEADELEGQHERTSSSHSASGRGQNGQGRSNGAARSRRD